MAPALIASFERAGRQWNVFLRRTSREIGPTGLTLVFSPGSVTSAQSPLLWPVDTVLLEDLLSSSSTSVLARIQQELDLALESDAKQHGPAASSSGATGRSA